MRSYVIDELRPEELKKIANKLKFAGLTTQMDDVFFLPVPEEFLDDEQREHAKGECGRHIMAVELHEEGEVRLEMLVRARGKIRCSCIKYAPSALRTHMIEKLDKIIKELDIPV